MENSTVKKKAWYHPIAYAYIAGSIGGLQNITFKAVSELIGDGGSSFFSTSDSEGAVVSWAFVLGTVTMAVVQLQYMNKGLRHFDGTMFLPIYSCFIMVSGVMLGGLYYQEFSRFTLVGISVFPVGCTMAIFGILLLAKFRHERSSSTNWKTRGGSGENSRLSSSGGSSQKIVYQSTEIGEASLSPL